MNFISLFSGIGGFDLGLEAVGMTCIGQVEIEPYCRKVLSKHWPHVKKIGDIHNVKANTFGTTDIVCGGFPCQPFSVAGKQRGEADDRYLWPEMFRVIKTYRPAWVLCENVSGIIKLGLDQVLSDLESAGYAVQAFIIPACAINAPHRRDRVWIVGYSDRDRKSNGAVNAKEMPLVADSSGQGRGSKSSGSMADSESPECKQSWNPRTWRNGPANSGKAIPNAPGRPNESGQQREDESRGTKRISESGIRRVVDGLPAGMDGNWPLENVPRVIPKMKGRRPRLKALGNAVVPQIVAVLGKYILESEVSATNN